MTCLLLTIGANNQESCEATLIAVSSAIASLTLFTTHIRGATLRNCFILQSRHILMARYPNAFPPTPIEPAFFYRRECNKFWVDLRNQESNTLICQHILLISMIVQTSLKSVTKQ